MSLRFGLEADCGTAVDVADVSDEPRVVGLPVAEVAGAVIGAVIGAVVAAVIGAVIGAVVGAVAGAVVGDAIMTSAAVFAPNFNA